MGVIAAEYDESVDALYLAIGGGEWDHLVSLDDSRMIDYAADGSVIGIEILSPARKGVKLDGLPFRAEVERVLLAASFRVIDGAR